MSLDAYIWVANLPIDVCSHAAFRVLLKYADRADELGYNAWHTELYLADVLHCSTRTIRRARSELEDRGLLRRSEDRVADIRGHAGHRPVVYDVMTAALTWHENHGGTFLAKRPGYGGTDSGQVGGQLLSIETEKKPTTKTSQELSSTSRERAYGTTP